MKGIGDCEEGGVYVCGGGEESDSSSVSQWIGGGRPLRHGGLYRLA